MIELTQSTMIEAQTAIIVATMVDYADRLQAAMKEANVDIAQMARDLSMTYQGVKNVVTGVSKGFSIPNHFKASHYLKVRPEWLALGEGPMRAGLGDPDATDSVDYRTLALMIIAEHQDVESRELMLQLIDLVDMKAAQLRQVAGQRALSHTP